MDDLKGISCRQRVLLAENSNVFEHFHKSLFESLGFKVDTVKNGYEINNKLRDIEYFLILMDMELSDMDCVQVVKEIFYSNANRWRRIIALAEMRCI